LAEIHGAERAVQPAGCYGIEHVVFRRPSKPNPESQEQRALLELIRAHMPGADDESVRIVTAIAGLLAGVAYADRALSAAEEGRIRVELGRVHWLDGSGIESICTALREHAVHHATTLGPRYTRELRELADRELRLEVLDLLIDLAAADGRISHDEVNVLRRTAGALGLSQADYNAAQARHRDKLGID
jgi:uncharacterized tellurite resistance protein B-like protein